MVDINKLVMVIENIYCMQVVQYLLGATNKDETATPGTASRVNKDISNVGLFLQKGKDQVGLFLLNSSPKNPNKSDEL